MFTKRDMQYFDVAVALAKTSPHFKNKLGAIIVLKNEVLSSATNLSKSHPMQKQYNFHRKIDIIHDHLHAEIHSIVKSPDKRKLRGATIYVSRVRNDQKLGMARPCPACFNALKDFGIKEIFYTTDTGFAQEIMS